jgi:hypothetical protein
VTTNTMIGTPSPSTTHTRLRRQAGTPNDIRPPGANTVAVGNRKLNAAEARALDRTGAIVAIDVPRISRSLINDWVDLPRRRSSDHGSVYIPIISIT